jgi:hypothetical protein
MSESISRRRFLVAGASVLAVGAAALVGGTYAQYKTSGTKSDSAHVAKFGVTVTPGGSLFATTYTKTDTTVTGITNSVSSSGSGNVVAPGTSSPEGGLTIALSGAPEVAVKVEAVVEYTDVKLGGNSVSDVTGDYYPIRYTLTQMKGEEVTYSATDVTSGSLAAAAEALAKALTTADSATPVDEGGKYTAVAYLEPGKSLAELVGSLKLEWEWAFTNGTLSGESDSGNITTEDQAIALDTALGDQESPQNPSFKVTVTVTQID